MWNLKGCWLFKMETRGKHSWRLDMPEEREDIWVDRRRILNRGKNVLAFNNPITERNARLLAEENLGLHGERRNFSCDPRTIQISTGLLLISAHLQFSDVCRYAVGRPGESQTSARHFFGLAAIASALRRGLASLHEIHVRRRERQYHERQSRQQRRGYHVVR